MSDFFRANVGCVLINNTGHVLALERSPKGSGQWQMVQGGIEPDEAPREAMFREVEEEVGLAAESIEFLDVLDVWLAYELPPENRSARTGRGQVQKWFICRVRDPQIDLAKAVSKEFASWRWTTMREMSEETWEVRRPVYRELESRFESWLA